MVECKECGNDYGRLSGHIQVHDMTIGEYKEKYPDAPTNSEESVEKISESMEKRHEENPEWSSKTLKKMRENIDRDKQKEAAREYMLENNPMYDKETVEKMMESVDIEKKTERLKNWVEENGSSMKGKQRSEEFKEKLSQLMEGRSLSDETIERIKESSRKNGVYQEFSKRMKENNPMKKDSVSAKISGSNHYRWKGGASQNQYGSGWTPKKREKVRERDNNCCFLCGLPNTAHQLMRPDNASLPVHHVDGDKENNAMGNLLTTCFFCHNRIHNSENLKPENLVVVSA